MVKSFGDFLQTEINKRGMSNREFARYVGINHQTVNRFLDFNEQTKEKIGYPSIDLLVKLSRKLGVDICVLMGLIEPDLTALDIDVRLLSQQIEGLPVEIRNAIDALIVGAAMKNSNKHE